jgi:anti-anti-sigma regulatory factor
MKKLALDLRGVIFVDESGLELLRQMYRATQPELLANSPLTKHFAELVTGTTTDGEGD